MHAIQDTGNGSPVEESPAAALLKNNLFSCAVVHAIQDSGNGSPAEESDFVCLKSNLCLRCTLSKIPETEALLKKARLPLGVLIHPFKDLSHLPVIQCSTIVRCALPRELQRDVVYLG